ncbi:MAG: vitamin K epoxide reductase family protein [Candidatus Uhrbacteria bacterium]|nr:vitamin K epoxide reductase family protein [Candidatus Uhrbacteria bacterium]
MVFVNILLIFTSVAGFLLTLYIWRKKHSHQKMVCPIGGSCEQVMHGEYARFFGIPLEIIGCVYYAIIFSAYGAFVLAPQLAHPLAIFVLIGVTIIAFLFSVYLTFIQAFTLKEWCTLCLTSAGFCTVIFMGAVFASRESLPVLLQGYEPFIASIHLVVLALGLGAATVGDIFFLKFLRDFHISEWERDVLTTISQVTWFALAAIILSSAGMVIARGGFSGVAPAIQAGWIVLGVILFDSAILHLSILPRLIHISLGKEHHHRDGELCAIHRFVFMSGAVSLASWYVLFVLNTMRDSSFSFQTLLTAYGGILIASIVAGRGMEYILKKR